MRIAMLLSGGVDSAVAAELLRRQGHDLHAFYIRIGRDDAPAGEGCSAEEDLEMCRAVTRRLSIPFDTVTLHEEYWERVMLRALDEARRGLTPNPDVMCNRVIKLGLFEERWGGAFDATATGHYAANHRDADGTPWLATAVDPVKDQTDFLCRITLPQLSHALFPLGGMPKAEVRETARRLRLPNAARRDSQGICFLGKIDYAEFLRRRLGERPGPVVDVETGRTVGEHRGHWFHTIGQRKGLGLSGGPWFVVGKDTATDTLYVANGWGTPLQYGRELPLTAMHWITRCPWPALEAEGGTAAIAFKNRHTPDFTGGTLRRDPGADAWTILADDPVQGIAPGQFAVVYTPDRRLCLGSGVICRNPLIENSLSPIQK